MYQHLGYARNKVKTRATREHFNLPCPSMNNMKFTILDPVQSSDPIYGRDRDNMLIHKYNNFYNGINMEP